MEDFILNLVVEDGEYATLLREFAEVDPNKDFIGFLVSLTYDDIVRLEECLAVPMSVTEKMLVLFGTREGKEVHSFIKAIYEETDFLKGYTDVSLIIARVFIAVKLVKMHKEKKFKLYKKDGAWYVKSQKIKITPRHDLDKE